MQGSELFAYSNFLKGLECQSFRFKLIKFPNFNLKKIAKQTNENNLQAHYCYWWPNRKHAKIL